MEYNFQDIESKWRKIWADNKTFKAEDKSEKPKYYVLDMFPYPSGAGLHVGHPLGYIASDIFARYKRLKGFNVLHPMGFDSFGLPAEQYAIETGKDPRDTTKENIATYKKHMLLNWEEFPMHFLSSAEKKTGKADILKFIGETNLIYEQLNS